MLALELVAPLVRSQVECPVVTKVPRPRPPVFIRLDQSAPVRVNPVVDRTELIVQVYAPDADTALGIAEHVREWLLDLDAYGARVQQWSESAGPYEFPDPDLPEIQRWQISGTIYHHIL